MICVRICTLRASIHCFVVKMKSGGKFTYFLHKRQKENDERKTKRRIKTKKKKKMMMNTTTTTTMSGRRKVSIFISLCILVLFSCVIYRVSTYAPAEEKEVGEFSNEVSSPSSSTLSSSSMQILARTNEKSEEEEEKEELEGEEEEDYDDDDEVGEEKSEDSEAGGEETTTTTTTDKDDEEEDDELRTPTTTTKMSDNIKKRPDERENVPGKYDEETAPKPPFKVPPVYLPRSIAEALEETGRGPTRPCKCVHGKNEAVYYLENRESGIDDDEIDRSESSFDSDDINNGNIGKEREEEMGNIESDENEAEEIPETGQVQSSNTKKKNAKMTFVIFHVANNEEHELSQAQVDGITMVLKSVINKHDKCRLVILTDALTDLTPLTNNFPDILEVRRHEFAQIAKGWTTYLRATAEKQFIFDEIEQKPQHLRDNIVFMDSTDVIFAKSIKNVFRDEETKVPHTFGAAWTYRDGSSGANKKWPINFGVRFVNAERIAEAALLSAYFVHAYEWFFYTERPNMRADSTQFFWEQDVANWLARRFKRFKDRKASDRGKYVDASTPIRYVVDGLDNDDEKGFRCRHVSMRFLPCFLYNANPPQTFPVKRLNSGRKNIGCPATTRTSVFHMKGALKRKMQDVFNYYGKPEINDKEGTKPKARRAKNRENNNTFIEYFGVMSDEDAKSRFGFCESAKASSSTTSDRGINNENEDGEEDGSDEVDGGVESEVDTHRERDRERSSLVSW